MNIVQLESYRTRQAMLAGSGALIAGGVALAGIGELLVAASPDADLLAACARVKGLYFKFHDFFPGGATPIADENQRAAAVQPLYDQLDQISLQIFHMNAVTMAGHRARASILLSSNMDFDCFHESIHEICKPIDALIRAALVRDLVWESAT